MRKGRLYLIISAFIYGLTPVLTRLAYNGGVNSITLTFLRSFLCIPILLIILFKRKVSLKLTVKELKDLLIAGILGNAFMLITLYASYDFIPVGLSTVLHYIYPLIIVIACALFFRENLSRRVIFAAILVTVGIMLFAKINSGSNRVGIILALTSGVLFAFNVVYLDKSGLDRMDYIKLTFYFSAIMSITAFLFAFFSKNLTFDISPSAWILSAVVSVLITLLALPLFQLGIMYEGAAEAGILSTAEPISATLLGIIFLKETITVSGIIGCVLIIIGIVLTETEKK